MILTSKMFSISAAISLAAFSNMPLIEADIDGVKAILILDTGASHTTFNSTFVTNAFPNAKLEPVMLVGPTNAKANVPCVFGAKKLKIGELVINAKDAMALPLDQLSASVGQRVDGILGMNHLATRPFLLSLAEKKITWDPTVEMCTNFTKVSSRLRGNRQELLAKLPNGEMLGLLIDSGSTWTFVDEKHWKTTKQKTQVNSADLNHHVIETLRRGEKGTIDCGIKLEIEPMIAPQIGLNQIGADTLTKVDFLLGSDGPALRVR